MPLVLLLVLAIVQLGVVVADGLQVQLAAREGARAASVAGASGGAGQAAAGRVLRGAGSVSVSAGARLVTVTARKVNHTTVPLIGALLPDVTLSATVTMSVEPP